LTTGQRVSTEDRGQEVGPGPGKTEVCSASVTWKPNSPLPPPPIPSPPRTFPQHRSLFQSVCAGNLSLSPSLSLSLLPSLPPSHSHLSQTRLCCDVLDAAVTDTGWMRLISVASLRLWCKMALGCHRAVLLLLLLLLLPLSLL